MEFRYNIQSSKYLTTKNIHATKIELVSNNTKHYNNLYTCKIIANVIRTLICA